MALTPTTGYLFIELDDEPDSLPTLEFSGGEVNYEIKFSAVVGRYEIKLTGIGSVQVIVNYEVSAVARQKKFTVSFVSQEVQDLLEADETLVLSGGVYAKRITKRGTSLMLIPDKVLKQPSGTDLTNPSTQRFGGAAQEPL